MHYTVVGNFQSTINFFTQDTTDGRVSSHYVVTESEKTKKGELAGGMVFQVVPGEKKAWHAGVSYWTGVTSLNDTSIRIENVNKGFVKECFGLEKTKWFPFDSSQIQVLGKLSQSIINRYNIIPQNVVGHEDIASGRKPDPGILFP